MKTKEIIPLQHELIEEINKVLIYNQVKLTKKVEKLVVKTVKEIVVKTKKQLKKDAKKQITQIQA